MLGNTVHRDYARQLDQQCLYVLMTFVLFFDLAIASSKHWPVSSDLPCEDQEGDVPHEQSLEILDTVL
jgi:hypothetical protein